MPSRAVATPPVYPSNANRPTSRMAEFEERRREEKMSEALRETRISLEEEEKSVNLCFYQAKGF